MTLESTQENVPLAGVAVRAISESQGFDPQSANMVQLALEEALTNVIRHAYQGRPGLNIELTVSAKPDRITLEIRHQGLGLASWPSKTTHPPDGLREGGRGIFLINNIMDQVSYSTREGASLLTMTKRRDLK